MKERGLYGQGQLDNLNISKLWFVLYSLSQNLAFHDKYRGIRTRVLVLCVPPGSEWPSGASNLLSEVVKKTLRSTFTVNLICHWSRRVEVLLRRMCRRGLPTPAVVPRMRHVVACYLSVLTG